MNCNSDNNFVSDSVDNILNLQEHVLECNNENYFVQDDSKKYKSIFEKDEDDTITKLYELDLIDEYMPLCVRSIIFEYLFDKMKFRGEIVCSIEFKNENNDENAIQNFAAFIEGNDVNIVREHIEYDEAANTKMFDMITFLNCLHNIKLNEQHLMLSPLIEQKSQRTLLEPSGEITQISAEYAKTKKTVLNGICTIASCYDAKKIGDEIFFFPGTSYSPVVVVGPNGKFLRQLNFPFEYDRKLTTIALGTVSNVSYLFFLKKHSGQISMCNVKNGNIVNTYDIFNKNDNRNPVCKHIACHNDKIYVIAGHGINSKKSNEHEIYVIDPMKQTSVLQAESILPAEPVPKEPIEILKLCFKKEEYMYTNNITHFSLHNKNIYVVIMAYKLRKSPAEEHYYVGIINIFDLNCVLTKSVDFYDSRTKRVRVNVLSIDKGTVFLSDDDRIYVYQ